MSSRDFDGDAGAPLPDFSGARNISLTTVGPALGVTQQAPPDYLEYDQKGRGLVVTMFANTGVAYLMGILGGGLMGLQRGLQSTPSTKWRVQVNSVLNATGRYGSKAGNTLGVLAVMYSLYEGLGDQVRICAFVPGYLCWGSCVSFFVRSLILLLFLLLRRLDHISRPIHLFSLYIVVSA